LAKSLQIYAVKMEEDGGHQMENYGHHRREKNYLNTILSDDFRSAFGEKEVIVFYVSRKIETSTICRLIGSAY
jgi:hypothetical protein